MILPAELIENINAEVRKVSQSADMMRLELMQLSEQFTNVRARLYLREGVMRRLGLMRRCVERIYEIHPPTRHALLDKNELDDLTINIQTFAINVYGILDNLAWVSTLLSGVNITNSNRMSIGLFKPSTQAFLTPTLQEYLASGMCKQWFDDYAKAYRDSIAHRIPVYVPPTMVTPEEAEQFRALEKEAVDALMAVDIDRHNSLKGQAAALGSPANVMLLTMSSEEDRIPEVPFHPQIICDWLTVHEILEKFVDGTYQQFNYSRRELPFKKFLNVPTRIVGAHMDVTIKSPEECTKAEIEEFESVVKKGNEVNEATLHQLVTNAFALAFIRDKRMVAVGALKRPNPQYRRKVFESAGIDSPDSFPLELGWVFVDKEYRGRSFSGAIVAELIERAGNLPVYATSVVDNVYMHKPLLDAGFEPAGKAYDSQRRDLKLHLFLCQ